MFFVVNKDKIISSAIAICTVFVLFLAASVFKTTDETVTTSSNANRLVPVYSVDTEEKKVSITINCAWNADDIDLILETLDKQNIKLTFFMVGDWIEKYRRFCKKDS